MRGICFFFMEVLVIIYRIFGYYKGIVWFFGLFNLGLIVRLGVSVVIDIIDVFLTYLGLSYFLFVRKRSLVYLEWGL